MKKLLSLLFILPLFMACSSDDDPKTSGQDYTSFVVANSSSVDLPNCVAGYQKNGNWIKVAELGNLNKGQNSSEIRVNDASIKEIYIFTDYLSPRRIDKSFNIQVNKKNNFELTGSLSSTTITDKTDSSKYPQ